MPHFISSGEEFMTYKQPTTRGRSMWFFSKFRWGLMSSIFVYSQWSDRLTLCNLLYRISDLHGDLYLRELSDSVRLPRWISVICCPVSPPPLVSPNTHCYGRHVCGDKAFWELSPWGWHEGGHGIKKGPTRADKWNSKWQWLFNSFEHTMTIVVFQHNVPKCSLSLF